MAQTKHSTWAPMASRVFAALWVAQLVSNFGTWMQTVGAQWQLVGEPNAATLVSLVQTATTLPIMLLSLPSGVLADLVDRRRLLITSQSTMAVVAAILTGLTGAGLLTPGLLLTLLFLLGCGQALNGPAWQAIQPELVPRSQIPDAAALNSMNMNIARAVGPAIAGFLVSLAGPTLVFGLNAVSFLAVVAVLVAWHPPSRETELPAERPGAALSAGMRFVRSSPAVRRILLRSLLFVAPAVALWALLPVVASDQLGLGAGGYGILLGALGVGAVAGAVGLGAIRARLSSNRMLALSAAVFGVATLVLATVTVVWIVVVGLVFAGLAWLLSLSSLNASMQLMLPAWVRARGLSAYLLIFMGGQAIGSLIWGVVAHAIGTPETLLIAGALLLGSAASVRWFGLLPSTGKLDMSLSAHWPEPHLVFEPDPADGPVLVLSRYRIDPASDRDFRAAMVRLARSRQRTGAMEWRLYRDDTADHTYIESFVVASWAEHMHQHTVRLTVTDRRIEERVEAFATEPVTVRHLLAVRTLE